MRPWPRRSVRRPVRPSAAGPQLVALEDRTAPAYFSVGTPFAAAGTNPFKLATGDFTGDGRIDFVAANAQGSGSQAATGFYKNNAGGTFTGSLLLGPNPSIGARSVAVGDFNGDGKLDLAVGLSASFGIMIYLGDGAGGFALQTPSPFAANAWFKGLKAADVTGDGKIDLIGVADGNPNVVRVYAGNGDGTFNPTPVATKATGGKGSNDLVLADFDGDGKLDAAGVNVSTGNEFVAFGAGGGTFGTLVNTAAVPSEQSVAVATADFNGDGKPDLIALRTGTTNFTGGELQVFLSGAGQTFGAAKVTGLGSVGASSLAVGDFNGDGKADVAVVTDDGTTSTVQVLFGNGDGTFTPELNYPVSSSGGIATADLNGDNLPDLVTTNSGTNSITVLTNTGGVSNPTSIVSLVASPSPSGFGTAVNFTAGVVGIGGGGAPVTGSVEFFDGTTLLGTKPVSGGTAVFTTATLSLGTHPISATYLGNTPYPAATSTTVYHIVTKATPSASLTAPSGQTFVFGQSQPVSYSVTAPSGSLPNPTGSVTFTDGATTLGTVPLSGGVAAFTATNLAVGSHTISAAYSGDATYNPTSSASGPFTINQASTTLSATPNANPAFFGSPVTYAIVVAPVAPGGGVVSGTVSVSVNGSKVGSATLDANGKASFDVTGLAVGTYPVSFGYPGSTNYLASSSNQSLTISQSPTTTGLTFAPAAGTYGVANSVAAAVLNPGGAPATEGTVAISFSKVGDPTVFTLPTVDVATAATGIAFATLDPGQYVFAASYSGGSDYTASSVSNVSFTSNKATPTAAVTFSPASPIPYGKDITFTLRVTPPVGAAAAAGGTAALYDGTTLLSQATVVNGVGTLVTNQFTIANHTVTAKYLGDAHYGAAQGQASFSIFRSTTTFAVGPGPGGGDAVQIYNPDGTPNQQLFAFSPDFTSGVRVAMGDFNGDGVQDLVVGSGPGTPNRVRVFDGATKALLKEIFPFEQSFTGGVNISVGDVTGDLIPDIVISPDEGGGPRVQILDGKTFAVIADFFGIDDPNFRGGARTAVGDVNGDGTGDLLVSAGFGGGPRVAGYDGKSLTSPTKVKLFGDFFAFESTLRNGVFLASGDYNGDGYADVVVGAGPGGGPRVQILSGRGLLYFPGTLPIANFFAGDPNNRGGVPVATRYLDTDDKADLVTGTGFGGGSGVSGYLGSNLVLGGTPTAAFSFNALPDFTGGVYVG